MRPKFQYRRNQILIFDNYEKMKQKSSFSKDEKYQSDKKKADSKVTTDEAKMNQEIETNMNSFEYSILLDFKLATVSHVRLKSFIRKRVSVLFSNKRKFQLFNKFYFSIQSETEESSRKKKTTNQFRNEINFRRKSDSKFQTINFIDESNKKANRAFYNKISYVRNAMIILIINKIFSDSSEF